VTALLGPYPSGVGSRSATQAVGKPASGSVATGPAEPLGPAGAPDGADTDGADTHGAPDGADTDGAPDGAEGAPDVASPPDAAVEPGVSPPAIATAATMAPVSPAAPDGTASRRTRRRRLPAARARSVTS